MAKYPNSWTRNARKLIKGSEDSDFSLASNKNLSEILPSSIYAQGQVTCAKMAKNRHLRCHLQKLWNPNQKIFSLQPEDSPSLLRVWIAL